MKKADEGRFLSRGGKTVEVNKSEEAFTVQLPRTSDKARLETEEGGGAVDCEYVMVEGRGRELWRHEVFLQRISGTVDGTTEFRDLPPGEVVFFTTIKLKWIY